MIDRREFLKAAGLYSLLGLGIPRLALGQSTPSHLFVHFHIFGGAHSMLGPSFLPQSYFDKRTKNKIGQSDYYRVINDEEAILFGDTLVGPSMAPLEPWFSDISIFDGIMMKNNSVDHGENAFYIQTGSRGSNGYLVAEHVGTDLHSRPFSLASTTNVDDKTRGPIINIADTNNLAALKAPFGYSAYEKGVYQPTSEHEKKMFELYKNSSSFLNKKLELAELLDRPEERFLNIVAGYLSGNFSSAFLNTNSGGNIDSHQSLSVSALGDLTRHYTEVSSFLSLLSQVPVENGKSLLDETTVLVTTDFSRSTWKEGNDGSGHNPWTNAAIVYSRKLRGQTKYGASDITAGIYSRDRLSKFHAMPFDFDSGKSVNYADFVSVNSGNLNSFDSMLMDKDLGKNLHLVTPEVVINTIGKAINSNYKSQFFVKRLIKEALV